MGRIIKFLFYVAVLGFLGLVAYAYLGPMTPETTEIRHEVTLDAGN